MHLESNTPRKERELFIFNFNNEQNTTINRLTEEQTRKVNIGHVQSAVFREQKDYN